MGQFSYKSLCWSFGTTSFRTKNFNRTIEEQLRLLRDFWGVNGNESSQWSANERIQTDYYEFMKSRGFLTGNAPNRAKDAREKTSGLVDLGLISSERRITDVGKRLLDICDRQDFTKNNPFDIDSDSYLYLLQLLKVSYEVNGHIVRPFIALLKLLIDHSSLSEDEFTYLLPLCSDLNSTQMISKSITDLREGKTNIDSVLINYFLSFSNYQEALSYFLEKPVDESLIMDIGMNRKSRSYDRDYYVLYANLKEVFLHHNYSCCSDLYEATKSIKIGSYWRNYLFDTISGAAIRKEPKTHLTLNAFSKVSNELEFKQLFFTRLHLFKLKATLFDYKDLNRRYIKTSDIVLFRDNQVSLDIIPRAYFSNCIDSLFLNCFKSTELLDKDVTIDEIIGASAVTKDQLLQTLSSVFGKSLHSLDDARRFAEDERERRFLLLINQKFTDTKLVELLSLFERRKDDEIQKYVTDNADIPTIFEYVLGIIWYKVSDFEGNIFEYLNLSLDADLLPKTHAQGGEADIVYNYSQSNAFPKHSLLIEATLADSSNQRRMEMEPVSRHLGQFLIKTGNLDSYCLFVTTYLDINVISDFRSRKETRYYDTSDFSKSVPGMKIIPIETSELKTIIQKNLKYRQLYHLFDDAFNSQLLPHEWYQIEIKERLEH